MMVSRLPSTVRFISARRCVAAGLGGGDQFEGLLPLRVVLGQELAGREEHRAGQTGVGVRAGSAAAGSPQ